MDIYKYMSFEQFVSMVEKNQLYLTRIDRWEDVYEGVLIKVLFNKLKEECFGNYQKIGIYNILEQRVFQSIYAQSWSTKEAESDAMWRIYSPNNIGVRIKVDCDKTRDRINTSIKCKGYIMKDFKVTYEDEIPYPNTALKDFILDDEIMYPIKYKRVAFQHEDEYRFATCFFEEVKIVKGILRNIDRYGEIDKDELQFGLKKDPLTISYDICLCDIKEVVLDPRAPKYHKETFERYCDNRGIPNTLRKQSTLYTFV